MSHPNGQTHLPPEAVARHERRLEAVRCSASLGAGLGRDLAWPSHTSWSLAGHRVNSSLSSISRLLSITNQGRYIGELLFKLLPPAREARIALKELGLNERHGPDLVSRARDLAE